MRNMAWTPLRGPLVVMVVVAAVLFVVTEYNMGTASASDSFELSPMQGVNIVGKHLVRQSELYAISWPEPVQRIAERGGMKMRREMLDQWDDYVLAVLYLDDGVWFNITMHDTLVLSYGSTSITSSECLASRDVTETELFRASRNELSFDDTWKPNTKSGGYLLAFRFAEDSLPRGGAWGFKRPDAVHLQRGTQ